jgi:4-amino-4-deoxy-L-arabinose transferase-like glycosyltransferase
VPPGPVGRGARFPAAAGLAGALALFALLVGLHLAAPRLDADQAVTGLMGIYILQGDFPVFFWGQHHAGVPESYGAAVSFFLLGVSRAALNLVPALAALGLLLLVHRTGRILFGPGTGTLAVLFATVVSPYMFAHYVRARSYYVEHLLLGQALLLGAAVWLARGPVMTGPARSRALIAMGLAAGLGLYCGFQIIDAVVPALLALLLVEPRLPLRRGAWLGAGAFLLGSLPFWIYNLRHDWATVGVGVRFQGSEPAGEAARTLLLTMLPIVLGVRDWVDMPPYLPWPAWLVVPGAVAGAVGLLLLRVVRRPGTLRRDPARAGEALLLVTLAVTLGVVWYGRFLRVPRYLVPVGPVVALILARACQLAWRRAPVLAVAWAGAYLVAVGVPLARDLTILWPRERASYQAERAADQALFAFLRAEGVTRAYSFDYWLAPRLTFDAGAEIIVAEAWNERYPPHAEAVEASPRPAYVLQGNEQPLASWLGAIGVRARVTPVGGYTVFDRFTEPPAAVPLARARWGVQASPGRGDPRSVVDASLATGWASAPGPPRSAWVELDLGTEQPVSGVTLVSDRPDRVPGQLVVEAVGRLGDSREVAALATGGLSATWANGAPRVRPSLSVTLRFPPVLARRIRLVDAEPAGRWSVAELFLLAPREAPGAVEADDAVAEGRRLEAAGRPGPALVRYREAMHRAPDAPDGYEAFARLASELRLRAGSPAQQAARLAELGLFDEARATYAEAARALGPGRSHAELLRAAARVARAAGDTAEAARLEAEAAAVLVTARPVGAVLGRVAELVGYDLGPGPAPPGGTIELTTHWRLLARSPRPLMVWVHFRPAEQVTRFGDDYPLPVPLAGPDGLPQHVSVHRRVPVPADAAPGHYRIVAGVWDPTSGRRLHRWWRGLVPTFQEALRLGSVEVVRPGG